MDHNFLLSAGVEFLSLLKTFYSQFRDPAFWYLHANSPYSPGVASRANIGAWYLPLESGYL